MSDDHARNEAILQMRQNGMSWKAIGRQYGVAGALVRYWVDPEYRQRQLKLNKKWRKTQCRYVDHEAEYLKQVEIKRREKEKLRHVADGVAWALDDTTKSRIIYMHNKGAGITEIGAIMRMPYRQICTILSELAT